MEQQVSSPRMVVAALSMPARGFALAPLSHRFC